MTYINKLLQLGWEEKNAKKMCPIYAWENKYTFIADAIADTQNSD